jgi:methyl-accepting chemotaxis protein
MNSRTLLRLCLGLTLALVGCSNNSSPSSASPPSSVPVVTPNPSNTAFTSLCTSLGQLEQVVAGIVAGTVTPSDGIQQVQAIGQSLADQAQQLRETQPEIATTLDDLSQAIDELRTALTQGGNTVAAVSSSVAKIGADLQRIPTNVCGSTPSPIPSS